ncbi:MAG: TetR/AcrR family transcriptional regulator [Clostridium sp.]|nr:TetR/AcrR family transcriptional regulator [Clostridium sp.]
MSENDLRKVKTLESIDNSLLNNLNSLTFTKITVDSLCKDARINRSTFYKYYKDKYDLLDKYIDRILNEFSSNVKTEFICAAPSNVECSVYHANFKKLLIIMNKNKSIYKILWTASIDRHLYNEMTSIVQNNIVQDLNANFKLDSNKKDYASLFASIFASNLMTVVNWWFLNDDHISIDEVVNLMGKITSEGSFMTLRKML